MTIYKEADTIAYKNVEKFEAWLKETLKTYSGNLDYYLDDLDSHYCSTGGSGSYEISPYLTKSGHPECYYFDVVDAYEDDSEDAEWIGREYIF